MAELRYREETEELHGIIFTVRNELGGGRSEEVFHQGLLYLLKKREIPVESKPRRPFWHRGVEVRIFEPDLIVWDKIILELKVMPYQKEFPGKHYGQIIHYLKFWEKDLGLLVNFAPAKVRTKRVIWDEPEWDLLEEYDSIRPYLTEQDKENLRQIRQTIISLAHQYGFGYPETLYRKLIAIESEYNQLSCLCDVGVRPNWRNYELPRHVTSHLLMADSYLVQIRSLLDYPTVHDFISTKTFLKCLGLNVGLVVNFGKKQLQIYGVKSS